MMKTYVFLIVVITVALLAAEPVSGCHKRRKRRSIVQGSRVKAFFPRCLRNQLSGYLAYANRNWTGSVSFALFHSAWYEQTDAVSCVLDHTVSCWVNSLPNFISGSSPVLRAAQRCVKAYYDNFYRTYAPDPYYPPGTPFADSSTCATVDTAQYRTELLASIDRSGLSAIDESISNFNDVEEFARTDMICPTCSCENLDKSDGDPDDYYFEDGKSCGACWTTRLATGVRGSSRFRRPAARLAKKRGGLKRRRRARQAQGHNQPGPRSSQGSRNYPGQATSQYSHKFPGPGKLPSQKPRPRPQPGNHPPRRGK